MSKQEWAAYAKTVIWEKPPAWARLRWSIEYPWWVGLVLEIAACYIASVAVAWSLCRLILGHW